MSEQLVKRLRVKRIKWDAFGNLYVGYPGVDYKIRLSDEKFVVIANIDWHGKEEPRSRALAQCHRKTYTKPPTATSGYSPNPPKATTTAHN